MEWVLLRAQLRLRRALYHHLQMLLTAAHHLQVVFLHPKEQNFYIFNSSFAVLSCTTFKVETSSTVSSSPTSASVGSTTLSPSGNFTCPQDGFFPIRPDACSNKYYTCINGDAFLSVGAKNIRNSFIHNSTIMKWTALPRRLHLRLFHLCLHSN